MLADLRGTKIHLASGREREGDVGSYIIIFLMGRFKGEMGEMYHLTPLASTTDSVIEVRKLIVLFILSLLKKGTNNGSIYQD